ncbi:MAG: hypothetical protein UZ12_BCD005001702 [Bacteroidetes bacterium OLB12]|nr:MAG: hypothetical protein UZ12_BCD005001702 [Bacteroidetes bacterium OLB12]HNU43003.1 DUF2452 domain-containing protein [Cyclobacteriaceae bacterium]
MVDAYNFLASWQLFPEKGTYEFGSRPKSGIYKIELTGTGKQLAISMNWVSLEDQAFASQFTITPDATWNVFEDAALGDAVKAEFESQLVLKVAFAKAEKPVLEVLHEITPKGYLRVVHHHYNDQGEKFTNEEIYHKQLSVLPYSASVSGAVIKPNEAGVIRHQALSAMEEQTNMQLTQIRQQIELLAIQAKEIQKRKELSMLIYEAQLGFAPVIGQTYYLYEKEDGSHLLSLVGPKEWGRSKPYKNFVAAVSLLADHTWKEI